MAGQLVLDMQRTEPVDSDPIEQLSPNEERRHAETAEHPLVGAAAHEIHSGLFDVDREHPDGLNRVGVEQRAVRVRQLRVSV